jgi:hypothetical protein
MKKAVRDRSYCTHGEKKNNKDFGWNPSWEENVWKV